MGCLTLGAGSVDGSNVQGQGVLAGNRKGLFFNYVWNSLNKCCCVACIAFFVLLFIYFFYHFFPLNSWIHVWNLGWICKAKRKGRRGSENQPIEGGSCRILTMNTFLPFVIQPSTTLRPAPIALAWTSGHWQTIRSAFDSFGPFARSNATVPLLLNYLLRYCRLVIGSLRWLVVCVFSLRSTIVFWMLLLPWWLVW